jgi:hypothetical protein
MPWLGAYAHAEPAAEGMSGLAHLWQHVLFPTRALLGPSLHFESQPNSATFRSAGGVVARASPCVEGGGLHGFAHAQSMPVF